MRERKGSFARSFSDRLERLDNGCRKLLWRIAHPGPRETRPIYIFGAQRSGTGMLGMCLGASPECENLGESDARAFHNYSLRDVDVVVRLIEACPYRFLVFKPLKDSHRVRELLDLRSGSKGVWAYRNFTDRINSAVQQFGRRPLEVFGAFQGGNRARWQLQGMSARTAETISSFRLAELGESDGAALMWWVRNSLFFDQELDRDPRVRLWSYDRFVLETASELEPLLTHAGMTFDPRMLRQVHSRSVGKRPPPPIDARILELCESLHARLEAAHDAIEAPSLLQP